MMPEVRVAPPLAPAEASRIASEIYGLQASARSLPGEYDDNFHLIAGDSQQFVLKLMHPAREESFVEMQCQALAHLSRRVPQLNLPRVVANRKGQLYSRIQAEDGLGRLVWLLSYIEGASLVKAKPHSPELLASLGSFLAQLDLALLDFEHPATHRELKWDLSRPLWAGDHLTRIDDPERRALAEKFISLFEAEVLPRSDQLRRSVIYGDANDYNVLVSPAWPEPRRVISVIDFGDMHLGYTVAEPAVAAAYAMLGEKDPLAAASSVIAGYHERFPLREAEIATFFALAGVRLAVSVINSAHRRSLVPDDPYVTVSETPGWQALERLAQISPRFAHYTLRAACGHSAVPNGDKVVRWLSDNSAAAGVVPVNLREGKCLVLDLGVGSTFLGADPANATESRITGRLQALLGDAGAAAAIGRYNEPRSVYSSPAFAGGPNPTDERRTVHLGVDVFVEPGTPVSAPFDAKVKAFADNQAAFDYGPVVILEHETGDGLPFFTLYGHLARASLGALRLGAPIARGQSFAQIGAAAENGGWTPHLHFQIILDLLNLSTDFPGVAFPSQRAVFTSLSPNPNLILGIPEKFFPQTESFVDTLAGRQQCLGGNLSLSYARPLKMVRGWRQYLYDDEGRAYLDVYNNVPLVGHSHPRVVTAVQGQIALLNTNSRYLHENILRYAERLTALLPSQLRVCYFLSSGSEANELALRIARTHTGHEDVIVLEHAYHGHTNTLIDISPYKFNGPGGKGQKSWVHVAPIPDDYRGLYRWGEPELGKKYAAHIGEIIHNLKKNRRGLAAYIAETLPSVAGQIVFPAGYLQEAYGHVRGSGGLCIADEVQVGFGRLGAHFWGFESQGVEPDIVVLGKPIGNGFPLAAVITTREIAASFANGMEFFSTFGGNPVACAAGLAVLDVLRDERLQENALVVGRRWSSKLGQLQSKYPLMGDVRGAGLFLGIELVNDRGSRQPATEQSSYIVNRLRDRGILAGTDGPEHNVIKLRPPLIFSDADADLFLCALEEILQEDPAQPRSCC